MNFTKIKPVQDWVALDITAPIETISEGGIVLPLTRKGDARRTGVVVAVGPGKWVANGKAKPVRLPVEAKVGQEVFIGPYSMGQVFKSEGREILFIRDSELKAAVAE